MGSLPRAIFRALRAQPLYLVLVEPTDGVLKGREDPFSHAHEMKAIACLLNFSLLLFLVLLALPSQV
jgi:hypothetical protein